MPPSAPLRADARAVRARRRPEAVLDPDVDARGARVPAQVLRLGARLLLAADAAAAAVRRPLRRLHRARAARRRRPELPGDAADGDRALHVLRGGHGHRGRLGARPREAGAQDPVPAAGDPAVGGADGVPELRAELRRGHASSCSPRASPRAGAGSRSSRWSLAPRAALDRHRHAALGAVRALPRRAADLGRRSCRCRSTARRSSTRSRTIPDEQPAAPDHVQPAGGDRAAGAPRDHRPDAPSAAEAIGGARVAADPARDR